MSVHRVAVIFDNRSRPETTGLYCRRALGCLVEVEHFLPDALDEIPPGRFDLFLYVDDGLDYAFPAHLKPAAYWAIDTHLDFERALQRAGQVELVFAAQRPGAARLQSAGIAQAEWLPLACDPVIQHPQPVEKQYDACFVGHLFPGPRQQMIDCVQQAFPNLFVGRRYFEQMAENYSASRTVLNRSVADDLNMRVFEALSCQSLLLTNDLPDSGQRDLFRDGVHLATYTDHDELLDKLRFYLRHDELRERIAQAGCHEVRERHTYLHRMTVLLTRAEQHLATTSQPQPRALEPPIASARPQVSACLVSWKRPDNIRQIVQQLRCEPLIDDIVIWNNNPEVTLAFDDENVTVIDSPRNRVTYGRYLAARQAQHDVIYTQDDDCLVHNLSQLYESFCRDESCISHALKPGHLATNAENLFGEAQMALVGWGAFFRSEWCDVLDEYVAAYGEDDLLDRKADRLFSLLLNRRHRSLPARVSDLAGASGAEALSVRDDHFQLTREAVARALALIGGRSKKRPEIKPVPKEGELMEESTQAKDKQEVTPANGIKESAYFDFARPELLERIPLTANRILDVGCGAGRLGAAIKARQAAEVWGIEREANIADRAQTRLDHVIQANAEQLNGELNDQQFDAIVCGDVLEHLRDPLVFLRRAAGWLSPTGRLIASLPNVRHWTVIASLLEGNWTYEAAGLLDEDHVRFFTRREIEKLLFRAGFEVIDVGVVPGPGYSQWDTTGRPGVVDVGRLKIGGLSPEAAEEFFTYQYLVTARPQQRLSVSQRTLPVTSDSDQPAPPTDLVSSGFARLRQVTPWPAVSPDAPVPTQHTGWLADGLRSALDATLNEQTRLVVELGSWLGESTRYTADRAPHAQVVAIDHWQGSPEHQRHAAWQAMLPRLFETFQTMCWPYREQILPLRMTTLEGLRQVAECGLQPDVIVLDAEHSYKAVSGELALCRELFPEATLIGDDLGDPGVARAATEFAAQLDLPLQTFGDNWPAWRLQPRAAGTAAASEPGSAQGLTSIVIVTYNELDYTRKCVESIRLVTDEPYELIFVDNASSDGTPDYLESLEGAQVIRNATNRGFPAAVNQGIAASRGEHILLLNNDTLVTTGWLRRLLDTLHSAPDIGLVGPLSNNVSGPQQIEVGYTDLAQLDGFAWDLGQRQRGLQTDVERLVGFCLLFRRKLVNEIGLLDEQFGIGCFEDDDYCRRAIRAGYRAVIAQDAFVHHFGSRTFRASGVDLGQLLADNQQKFDAKWQAAEPTVAETPQPPPSARPQFILDDSDESGLLLKPNNIRLSLCMIVRDNEATIRPCLESIQPWVDEMIVVDTGSTDATPEICRELGARVFEFPWCDDFSAARNESLRHARGEWIFWMDSDDTIPENCGRQLRALATGPHADKTLGYVMQVHCPGADGCDVTVVDHVKLFPNRPDLRFEHRIHEQILPAIRRAGGEVKFTDLFVVHSGSDHSVEGKQRKLERDFRILDKDLAERPEHPFVLFNLGMTCADTERYEETIDYLQRSIEASQPGESHLRKAYALLVSSLSHSERHDSAWETCRRALELFPDDNELMFRGGMLHHHFGRKREAIECYERLRQNGTRHFTSIDRGISGYKAYHNLAIVYEELNELTEAERNWREAVTREPTYRAGWQGLWRCLLQQNKQSAAQDVADQLLASPSPLCCEGHVLQAELLVQQHQPASAREMLEEAVARYPDDVGLKHAWAQQLFSAGDLTSAAAPLEALVQLTPDDPSVHHNLATVQLNAGEVEYAIHHLSESLRLRPDSRATQQLLNEAKRLIQDKRSSDATLQPHDCHVDEFPAAAPVEPGG